MNTTYAEGVAAEPIEDEATDDAEVGPGVVHAQRNLSFFDSA